MLKLFYERNLLTKEQYEFEVETLKNKIKTGKKNVIGGKARNHRLQEFWAWQDTNEASQVPHC